MTERPQAVLRVEPHQIAALRAAFDEAARTIGRRIESLRWQGQITTPWLDDPVSRTILAIYDRSTMNGPASTYANLVRYRDELIKVYDNLGEIEAAYRRSDAEGAALLGSRA